MDLQEAVELVERCVLTVVDPTMFNNLAAAERRDSSEYQLAELIQIREQHQYLNRVLSKRCAIHVVRNRTPFDRDSSPNGDVDGCTP